MSSTCVDSILVNGYGAFIDSFDEIQKMASVEEIFTIDESKIFVKVNLVHAGFEFPVRFFRMDFGDFEVIETDGQAIEPFKVQQLVLGVGETFVVKIIIDWEGNIFYTLFWKIDKRILSAYSIQIVNRNLTGYL